MTVNLRYYDCYMSEISFVIKLIAIFVIMVITKYNYKDIC